jgi:hypothetical protein
MPTYRMYVFCNKCSETHPTILFELPEEIEPTQSLADAYKGREVPPQVAKMVRNHFTCPNTGGNYGEVDQSQVFFRKVIAT